MQGFGNVGSHLAVILSRLGVSTIAVGDHSGYMLNPEGFNAHKLQDWVETHGSIAGYPGGKAVTREEFFKHEGGHLRPLRAREPDRRERRPRASTARSSSRARTARRTPPARRSSSRSGVDILPDVLANSGGVTVSYYEWVQNKRSESWTEEEVDAKLEKAMTRAYREVADFARQHKVDRRIAAYGLGASAHRSGLQGARDLPDLEAEPIAAPKSGDAFRGIPAFSAPRDSPKDNVRLSRVAVCRTDVFRDFVAAACPQRALPYVVARGAPSPRGLASERGFLIDATCSF